jgi:hypothetical protein
MRIPGLPHIPSHRSCRELGKHVSLSEAIIYPLENCDLIHIKICITKLSMVGHTCNSSSQLVEAGGLQVQVQLVRSCLKKLRAGDVAQWQGTCLTFTRLWAPSPAPQGKRKIFCTTRLVVPFPIRKPQGKG